MQYKIKKILKNKIILITGASDGIGREASLTYARLGANVILVSRNKEKLSFVASEIKNKCNVDLPLYFNLNLLTCTKSSCQKLAKSISNYYSRLDGMLNNAAMLGDIKPMREQNLSTWKQVIQVNINGTFFLTQTLIPLLMKSSAGSLIFTSSSVGRKGRSNWGAYSVSKFATEGMMQILADEYQNSNLRVNCINPGSTQTKMRARACPTENTQKLKTPADIMPIYIWLMSDKSIKKTGITFDAQSEFNINILNSD